MTGGAHTAATSPVNSSDGSVYIATAHPMRYCRSGEQSIGDTFANPMEPRLYQAYMSEEPIAASIWQPSVMQAAAD